MSTSATPAHTTTHASPPTGQRVNRPRMWLVAGGCTAEPPPDRLPTVRDDLMHVWRPGPDGLMHMGRHQTSWHELRIRYDLMEVTDV
jgi:hypothetical protein